MTRSIPESFRQQLSVISSNQARLASCAHSQSSGTDYEQFLRNLKTGRLRHGSKLKVNYYRTRKFQLGSTWMVSLRRVYCLGDSCAHIGIVSGIGNAFLTSSAFKLKSCAQYFYARYIGDRKKFQQKHKGY